MPNQFTKISSLSNTNNEENEKEYRKITPFTKASKKIKYPGINLTQNIDDIYKENYKPLKKKIRLQKMERTLMLMG
jgi:hypothetical protein